MNICALKAPTSQSPKTLDKIEDSIRESYNIPTYGILRKLIIGGLNNDSLDQILDLYDKKRDEVFYKYFLKNHQTFLALEFIKIRLYSHSLSKQKLKILFDKLPNCLKEYPSYKECVKLFNAKEEKSPKQTAKPLWNGK